MCGGDGGGGGRHSQPSPSISRDIQGVSHATNQSSMRPGAPCMNTISAPPTPGVGEAVVVVVVVVVSRPSSMWRTTSVMLYPYYPTIRMFCQKTGQIDQLSPLLLLTLSHLVHGRAAWVKSPTWQPAAAALYDVGVVVGGGGSWKGW